MSVVSSYSDHDYEADAELVRRNLERFERLYARLEEINAAWARLNIEAEGGDGDVVLSVNQKGQLTSLSLAEGCTVRYTHLGLEELINTTLREAVKMAAAESGAVTEGTGIRTAGMLGE
jgi:YbaB/EbfC DNA-binding family